MESADLPIRKRRLVKLIGKTDEDKTFNSCISLVKRHLRSQLSKEEDTLVSNRMSALRSNMRKNFQNSHKKYNVFTMKYKHFLDSPVTMPSSLLEDKESTSLIKSRAPTSRKLLSYSEKGERAQRYQVANISKGQTEETVPLLKATIATMVKRGESDVARIIKAATATATSNKPEKIRRMIEETETDIAQEAFTPEEAHSFMLKLGLTQGQYNILRNAVEDKGHKDLFPPLQVSPKIK